VGDLLICVLVFTVLCTVCVLYCFIYVYLFLSVTSVKTATTTNTTTTNNNMLILQAFDSCMEDKVSHLTPDTNCMKHSHDRTDSLQMNASPDSTFQQATTAASLNKLSH
jgi:Ca2+/Na+ antiporter